MFWKSRLFLIQEQWRVIHRFYFRSVLFCLVDLALSSSYLLTNPYRICRRFFQKKGEKNIHAYGETPLTLWAEIVKKAQITSQDRFIDLGCGRGRLCFWTNIWVGCPATGVDWVPGFVERGCLLTRLFRLVDIELISQGISRVSLKNATIVYLYTYHPEEEVIDYDSLPAGGRVITVSEPLVKKGFVIHHSMIAAFPWGETQVFINKKI
jgi:hypothetical protein